MALSEKLNNILVINCGSSSLKISLFMCAESKLDRLFEAKMEGINQSPELKINEKTFAFDKKEVKDISSALHCIIKKLNQDPSYQSALSAISGIGHRVVHGGNFTKSQEITPEIFADIESLSELAPLHNPVCIEVIRTAMELFGDKIPNIAVFDTTFHQSMPAYASTYGLPYELSQKHQIKKYGFHGIAHSYLSQQYTLMQSSSQKNKIVTLQLGSGCSMAAIKAGKSIDTTMGFTPLEGLLMATRCGDIDPAVVEFLCTKESKSISEILAIFNFESGLWGVSGDISKNMRDLTEKSNTHPQAELAIEIFVYRIVKYLGAYMAVLGGIDAIIFSGGIGENSPFIRQKVLSAFEWLGIHLDQTKNQTSINLSPGTFHPVSAHDSSIEVYVVGCDENAFIAQETLNFIIS